MKKDSSKGAGPAKTPENEPVQQPDNISVKKLPPYFIDEIRNIAIAPNGACRLHMSTWGTGVDDKTQRVDSEIVMTLQALRNLSTVLPKVIEAAGRANEARQKNTEKDKIQ